MRVRVGCQTASVQWEIKNTAALVICELWVVHSTNAFRTCHVNAAGTVAYDNEPRLGVETGSRASEVGSSALHGLRSSDSLVCFVATVKVRASLFQVVAPQLWWLGNDVEQAVNDC